MQHVQPCTYNLCTVYNQSLLLLLLLLSAAAAEASARHTHTHTHTEVYGTPVVIISYYSNDIIPYTVSQ